MRRLENWLLKHLLNALTIEEVISNDPKTGGILIDGKPIKLDELKQMQAEVKAMEGFRVWKIMSETTKYQAEDKIFNKSINLEDIRFGKAMLYNLSLQKSILEVIKRKLS